MDASDEAYAAVAYLRVEKDNEVEVAFVGSKVRVAPVGKKLTIPKVELLGALLGARLGDTITKELNISIPSRCFWCDADLALHWIQSDALRYKEFVANRMSEIQDLTEASEWRWVPTSLNIADEATRLRTKIVLSDNSLWLTGPQFLKLPRSEWPEDTREMRQEDQTCEVKSRLLVVTTDTQDSDSERQRVLPDPERFSSYHRLLRTTAAVFAIAKYWKTRMQGIQCNPPFTIVDGKALPRPKRNEDRDRYKRRLGKSFAQEIESAVSLKSMKNAQTALIKEAQEECFPKEMAMFRNGMWNRKMKASVLWKLSPFLDQDGVLRMEGRIKNADSAEGDAKEPIILRGRHPLTELIVKQEHERNAHQGHATVFNSLRQRYWILNGRAAVRRVCERCQWCSLRKAKPIVPKMGALPHCRLAVGNPPFTFTGVDFFGPMEVTVGRHHEKRWGALFTCMVTRAIHLELAYGLSTDVFLLVFSNFVNVGKRPLHIYCDNGTNFVGGNRELQEQWRDVDWNPRVAASVNVQMTQFHFIPSLGAHFGGAWESLVKVVKKVIKNTLQAKYPKDQVLIAILKGAENIVNSRPLTYTSADPDAGEALTPNHFIKGYCDAGPSIPGKYERTDEFLRKKYRQSQVILDELWARWITEYLPELNRRLKWQLPSDPIQRGDIVLLIDKQLPRNVWVKAVVTAVFPGQDGQVRVVEATVRMDKKTSTYKRSVDMIIPLGLRVGIKD